MSRQGLKFGLLAVLLAGLAAHARADATLLLEEPYGKMGAFTAAGHVAVYLSNVCAESPLVLRRCLPGEAGVVISRYNGVEGYDWVAIPLMPYLYAVERPQDVPLFADPKTVAFLRDQYRRKYLAELIPDKQEGEMPGGNWYELVGSAYDRTMYGYQVKTSAKQDEQLILKLNAEPNQSHFRTVSHNCADFAKEVMNFYYPKALHRNLFSDVGIATPKQMAKSLVKYGGRHSETELSSYVIPQVPGSGPRSTKVRGVVESFVKTKKYMLPTMALHPIIMASVAVVYMGSGTGRVDPAGKALV
jgi:hypothetical protein